MADQKDRESMGDTPRQGDAVDSAMPGTGLAMSETAPSTDPASDSKPRAPGPVGPQMPRVPANPADRSCIRGSTETSPSNLLADGPRPPELEPRLAEAAKISDPYLRQQVEANVRLQTQREITAFVDGQRQVKAQAKSLIDQGGDLSSIPASLLLQIDASGKQALIDYAMAHGKPETSPVTYYGLKSQALDDPAAFQMVDLNNHMAKLSAKDYGDLQQLQAGLSSGQPPADLPLQQAYKANTDRLLKQLGLPTRIDQTVDAKADQQSQFQAAQLRQIIDWHIAATEIATGRKLTPTDQQHLVQQIALQHQPAKDPSLTIQTPVIAGTSTLAAAASEIAAAGEVAASGGALGMLAPLAVLTAGILAATTTRTAGRALDEYQPPLPTAPSKAPAATPIQILPRATPQVEDEDCEDERAKCTDLCLKALKNPNMRNIYNKHFLKCFNGCVPARCGGNPV